MQEFFEKKHNNAESAVQFELYKFHFSNQCNVVYTLLMAGGQLSSRTALKNHDIVDLRARIKQLIDAGVCISKSTKVGAYGAKTYYMSLVDRRVNKQKFGL